MFDLTKETAIGLHEAAQAVSYRQDSPVHVSTVLRWILKGVRTRDGSTVRLEGLKLGGRWLTSMQALQRFAERQTPRPGESDDSAPTLRTPTRRRRAVEQAQRELVELGI